MTTRPRLITSIPFWILLVASLAAIGVGSWIAVDRLGTMETALTSGTATGIEVYVGQPWAVIGGGIAAAGVVGLFLTLAVAALATILPRPAVEVVEAIDWSSEDETALDDAGVPAVVTASEPVTAASEPSASEPASEPAVSEPSASEPVSEDPDVETPSDAPAPARADGDSPASR